MMNEPMNTPDDARTIRHDSAHQIQQRLVHLDEQIDALTRALDHVQETTNTQQDQVAALLRAVTATDREQTLDARLAELITLLTTQGEQTTELVGTVQELARAHHVQALAEEVARQEQLEALEERVAKMVRTQFKTNTLSESQMQHLESALAVLREVADKRETRLDERQSQERTRLEDAHRRGRRELVADLLPGIDGLELVLQNGRALVARQRASAEAVRAQEHARAEAPATPTWRERLQTVLGGQQSAARDTSAAPADTGQLAQIQTLLDDTEAWLAGLELAHERFRALLAAEQIEVIDAVDQPFDPRLHVAVDAVEDPTRAPNSVVQVVRQGYRQGDRVLRYAEVVVTRGHPSSGEPSTEEHGDDATQTPPEQDTSEQDIS
jgi:molecular chaperone GrpE